MKRNDFKTRKEARDYSSLNLQAGFGPCDQREDEWLFEKFIGSRYHNSNTSPMYTF